MPEYIKCNLCSSDNTKRLYIKNSFIIVRCKKCGLVYVNPQPCLEELRELYKEANDDLNPAEEQDIFMQRFGKIIKTIERFQGKGRVLDIGCSYGYFLKIAQKYGWDGQGVEINDSASRYCREKLGLNVFSGDISDAHYTNQSFDVITMFHILEHILDPRNYLKEINRILKPGGLIAVEVPNVGSLKAKLTRGNWGSFKPPRHLYYFSPKTLTLLLEKTGFKRVRMDTLGGTYILTTMDKLGLKSIHRGIIKYFQYLSWLKSLLQYIQKLFRLQDVIIIYAKKEKNV